ncbi:4Fe-4S dicluster domain-containing protein [Desulfobacula sp.]
MYKKLELSTQLLGLEFKSPILISSSECTANISLLKKLINKNIGGIVTKTYTSSPENRIRVRPYQFPLNKFGAAFARGKSLYSLAAPHVEEKEAVRQHLADMVSYCKQSSVILVASFFENPQEIDLWIKCAVEFEDIGADMLELNFSSPSAAKIFSQSFESAGRIIAQVKKKTTIPIGIKLSPTLEPLGSFVKICMNAGIDFITAHNAPSGIVIDVDKEIPFGAPSLGGYVMGRTFLPYSLGRVVRIRSVADLPVIGVGGIYEAEDALQYLLCGCPLVGIGSAMYFEGPGVLDKISQGILDWMQTKNYEKISEFQGKAFSHIKSSDNIKSNELYPYTLPPECPWIPKIDDELCSCCGVCIKSCIYDVLRLDDEIKKIVIDEQRCWSCGFCVGICPSGAIKLVDRSDHKRIIWNNCGFAETFKK